jgi:hypothetical protein
MSQAGWKVWKDIAYPGTVHVPGPGNSLLRYNFTRSDMAAIARTGRQKVREGWNVPLCWEHQDVEPERVQLSRNRAPRNRDRDFALGVFGAIEDFALGADGRVKALVAGDDPKDYEQLKKVRFVSPEIQWDWVDTDGRLWRGPSVTHLAATPRPVQRHQNPVGTDPDAPQPRISSAETLPGLIRMSVGGAARVAPRIRLSFENWFPGGVNPMADDTNPTPSGGDGAKKQTPWERAAAALAMIGVKIGDGSNIKDADHFADLCEVACMNSQAAQPVEDELEPEETDESQEAAPEGDMEQPPEGASEPPPPPVQMSLEARQQIEARDAFILDQHRKDLTRRVGVLAKRFAPTVVNPLLERVGKVRLSLTDKLKLAPCALITEIETLERLPKDAAWSPAAPRPGDKAGAPAGKGGKKARLSQGTRAVARSPYAASAEESEEVAEEKAGEFFSLLGQKQNGQAA